MDLRPHNVTPAQLDLARELAVRGLLCYQPFLFADDFMTGAGYEFAKIAEGAGMVYYPQVPEEKLENAEVRRNIIDPSLRDEFADYRSRLADLYENFIEACGEHVGPYSELTFADVGCCSGYFPVSFAKRGAKRAVGYDVVDYTPSFALLNDVLGTNAEFIHRGYDTTIGGIPEAETFDVVLSIAVLVHLSDPLQHLAFLGRIAHKAILVWTWTSENEEDAMVIRYGAVNRYYADRHFPNCFDIMQISPGLLRKSLEIMGFTEIHQIRNRPAGMPDYWFDRHRGYLAVKPGAAIAPPPAADAAASSRAKGGGWLRRLLGG
jgi:2-polyprenyl-3-methyl-5-hydroxy-6-metoxy-1,4-benzoquinol methylase